MTQSAKRISVSEALSQGVNHHMAGRHRKADAIYRQVIKAQPDNADAIHLLGVLARQMGQPAAAVDLIRRAISLDGRNPTYHANLGTALEASDRRDDAITAYRRALDIKADYPEAHYKLGRRWRRRVSMRTRRHPSNGPSNANLITRRRTTCWGRC